MMILTEAEVTKQSAVIVVDHLDISSSDQIRVISGFEYRWFCGAAIPYVLYRDEYSDGAFPLMGHHVFKMSNRRLCPECFNIVEESENLCGVCQESDLHKRLRCILEGPGVPFDQDCTAERPACGLMDWSASVCHSKWIVYVASVFGVPKVGISRMNKDGCSMGFTKRLLSQGAESWIVLGPVKDLEYALVMESRVAEELMFSKSVTTEEKWQRFESGELDYNLPRWKIAEVARKLDLDVFLDGSFSQYYERSNKSGEMRFVDILEGFQGQLVSNYGPLMGFLNNDIIRVCSIDKAVGSVILGGL